MLNVLKLATESGIRTLQLVEEIARNLGILPTEGQPMAEIVKAIGTTGRDYSTMTSWEADLDNGAHYSASDTARGDVYNDSVFDETFDINGGGTIGLTAVTLTVPSGERHDGTAGSGARIVRTGGNNCVTSTPPAGITNTVEWLEVDKNGNSKAGLFSNAARLTQFNRMIVHGVGGDLSGNNGIDDSGNSEILNCIIYDCECTHTGARACRGILDDSARDSNWCNVTVHDIRNDSGTGNATCIEMTDDAGSSFRNLVATDPSGTSSGTLACYSPTSFSNATVSNNLSSDTTASGTGSLTSKASTDQFVSTTGGSEDLHLKSGADAIDAGTDLGTTPTNVNLDIDNRDRDAEGDTWDMGADEFVAAASAIAPLAFSLIHKMANA